MVNTSVLLPSVFSLVIVILCCGQVLGVTPDAQVTQAVEGFYKSYLKNVNDFIEGSDRSKTALAGLRSQSRAAQRSGAGL